MREEHVEAEIEIVPPGPCVMVIACEVAVRIHGAAAESLVFSKRDI